MKRRFVVLAAFATAGFSWFERLIAPSSDLIDDHWRTRANGSGKTVDHSAWNQLLGRYVETDDRMINRIDYQAVSAEDRKALDAYLAQLQSVTVTELPQAEQLAYWINLYNAQTVAIILDHYPVESIRDITYGDSFAIGPWGKELVTVEGRDLSLNDVEHGIIRPVFNEPRIHYAVNCAAAGCPNLAKTAFQADTLEDQMNEAARAYVNDPRGVLMTDDGELVLSSIYNWFRSDFGGSEAAVLEHIRGFADPDLSERLAGVTSVDEYAYDWSLNDAL
ncbi:MAG: DUF547 domain-containing protein [Geminicoccaceae bacterium]